MTTRITAFWGWRCYLSTKLHWVRSQTTAIFYSTTWYFTTFFQHHTAAKSRKAGKDKKISLPGRWSAESYMLPLIRRNLLPPSSGSEICAQIPKMKTGRSCDLAVVYQSTRRHIMGALTLHQYINNAKSTSNLVRSRHMLHSLARHCDHRSASTDLILCQMNPVQILDT